jgi:hypothetical protein
VFSSGGDGRRDGGVWVESGDAEKIRLRTWRCDVRAARRFGVRWQRARNAVRARRHRFRSGGRCGSKGRLRHCRKRCRRSFLALPPHSKRIRLRRGERRAKVAFFLISNGRVRRGDLSRRAAPAMAGFRRLKPPPRRQVKRPVFFSGPTPTGLPKECRGLPPETSLGNPFRVEMHSRAHTQGRCSFLAPTLGFVGKPRWGFEEPLVPRRLKSPRRAVVWCFPLGATAGDGCQTRG